MTSTEPVASSINSCSMYSKEIENLRRKIKQATTNQEERIQDLQNQISISRVKVNKSGYLHEVKYRKEIKKLQDQLDKASDAYQHAMKVIEAGMAEFERKIIEDETEIDWPNQEWILSFFHAFSSIGGSLSTSPHDMNCSNTHMRDWEKHRKKMTELQNKFQAASFKDKDKMAKLDRKIARMKTQLEAEGTGNLLRYIAPSIYLLSAAYTVVRTMPSQIFHGEKILPIMMELGSLTLPGMFSYFS